MLKNAGGLSMISLMPAAASAKKNKATHGRSKGKAKGHSKESIEILDVVPKKEASGADGAEEIMGEEITSTLASTIENETAYERALSQTVSFSVKTDQPQVNAKDPVISYVPFGAKDARNISVDNVGVMLVWSQRHGNERHPIASTAFSREKISQAPETGVSTQGVSDDKVVMKTFGSIGEGSITKTAEEIVEPQADGEVSSQSFLSCWGCTIVIDAVCIAAASGLTYSTCVSAAISTSVLSPMASAAVGGLCTYLVSETAITCTVGTAFICEEVLNDCSFTD